MTRYVKHKHGLTLASGNIFMIGESDVEWRAHISAYSYEGLSRYGIDTPAQQLIWTENIDLDTVMTPYMGMWLKEQFGPRGVNWDYNTKMHNDSEILFIKREYALKTIKHIEDILGNLEIAEF